VYPTFTSAITSLFRNALCRSACRQQVSGLYCMLGLNNIANLPYFRAPGIPRNQNGYSRIPGHEKKPSGIEFPNCIVCCCQGGVVLVSHDERLIRLICTEVWVCADMKVQRVEGGIDEYKKLVQQELAAS